MTYTNRPTTRLGVMERIRNAVATINKDEVLHTDNAFEERVEPCIENDEMHFEHLIRWGNFIFSIFDLSSFGLVHFYRDNNS